MIVWGYDGHEVLLDGDDMVGRDRICWKLILRARLEVF